MLRGKADFFRSTEQFWLDAELPILDLAVVPYGCVSRKIKARYILVRFG